MKKLSFKSPLIPSFINDSILMKCENLQVFCSYKIRGIENIIDKLEPHFLQDGLVAASAGNMGQAVAYIAKSYHLPCTIVVPKTAPKIKIESIKALGAQVIERDYNEVWKIVQDNHIDLPGYYIHPAQNTFLTEGYAIIAKEIVEQNPRTQAIIIPFGVGGLTLGIARFIKKYHPGIKIICVEPETAHPLYRLKYKNDQNHIRPIPSLVDAIGTPEVLKDVCTEILNLVDQTLIIQEEFTKKCLFDLYKKHHLVVEGAAACALAGAIKLCGEYQNITCILSGGNIDGEILQNISI